MRTKLLLVFAAILVVPCSSSTYCSGEEAVCEGEGTSLLDPPRDRLLYKISNEVQHNIISGSDRVFISIKTTSKYHSTRLPPILFTWLQNVIPSQVRLVTDRETDENDIWLDMVAKNGFSVIHADCPTGHQRSHLCCKSGVEFENYYRESRKHRWYCHFDDDVYVNLPMLLSLLANYDPLQQRVYLGRWPLAVKQLSVPERYSPETFLLPVSDTYRYATGAAYCISASLMTELEEYLSGPSKFESACNNLRLTDDMLVGCVIGMLGYNLTNDLAFTSHLNPMRMAPGKLKYQVTVSYGMWTIQRDGELVTIHNRMDVPNTVFSEDEDPTSFFSFHCLLYPETKWCSSGYCDRASFI